jgi:hypothetical protein
MTRGTDASVRLSRTSTDPPASPTANAGLADVTAARSVGVRGPMRKGRPSRRWPERSHAITLPSRPAVYVVRPSAEMASCWTSPASCSTVALGVARVASQTVRRPSRPAVTSPRESGVKRVAVNAPSRPASRRETPVRRSSKRVEPSRDTSAANRPLGLTSATLSPTGNRRTGRSVRAWRITVVSSAALEVRSRVPPAMNPPRACVGSGLDPIGRGDPSERPVRASQRPR